MALGLGAAFAATRLMKGLLFGVSPSDLVVFVAISLLLGVWACSPAASPRGGRPGWIR
jgi:hypothetical protein